MAYNSAKYQLTQLLVDAWYRLGQLKRWKVNSGTTTTAVITKWAGVEEQLYEDDDPSLIYGTLVVISDTAGAAPEGEFSVVSDYDSSSQTLTVDTAISAALASGDIVGVASPLFPLDDMIELANVAIQKLGDIDQVDNSVTAVSGQTLYTLPSTIRRKPMRVRQPAVTDAANPQYQLVTGWDAIPAAPGASWSLTVPDSVPNFTFEILYSAPHPKLTAYSSDILDSIHPELALCALVAEAYQWYNNQIGGSNQYFLQRENKAIQDLESARVRHPIPHIVEQVPGFPHWGKRGDYVPGTSDLRA